MATRTPGDAPRLTRRDLLALATVAGLAPALPRASHATGTPAISGQLALAPPGAVTLSGLLGRRYTVNLEGRLQRVEPERLLAPFEPAARERGDGGWLGEHAGKFLDAACCVLADQPDAALAASARRVAQGLLARQEPDGYLGSQPAARRWTGWDVWVHKYHLLGLLAYHDWSGDAAALEGCRRIFRLLAATFGEAPGQRDLVRAGEHVGMAATSVLVALCALYRRTGDRTVLDFAGDVVRAYDHPGGPRIVAALLEHGEVHRTANGKAYELLSNLVGLVELHRLTGEPRLLAACLAAWRDIVGRQVYPSGAVSAGEHFQPPPQQLAYAASNVGETCASVNWIEFNAALLELTGEARFAAEIERTVYNHLLAAQDPDGGDLCYYTAFAGRKEYSPGLLCCVSSGPRALARLPRLAFGTDAEGIVVLLYAAARARLEAAGTTVDVALETDFPADGRVRLRVSPEAPARFRVRLRVPDWCPRFEVRMHGRVAGGARGEYLDLVEDWEPGATIEIELALPLERMAGPARYPGHEYLRRGPQLLALEASLNPSLPDLSRAAIGRLPPRLDPRPRAGRADPAYAFAGVVAGAAASGGPALVPHELVCVPFADARDFRALLVRHPRRGRAPRTAYARAALSTSPWMVRPGALALPGDLAESLTDEDPATYAAIDPRDPSFGASANVDAARQGALVWFSVILDVPARLGRLAFRHGPVGPAGGAFDPSDGGPWLELAPGRVRGWRDGEYPDPDHARWIRVGRLAGYPASLAAARALVTGSAFSLALPAAREAWGLRIVGRPAGDFVTCGELAGFDA
ncbi:MAG: glycoside hydrolase family 127 protein [Proteobacteria bacterium]|nr:glycoside hydrolase family 127 protein [Pseudomonadota bacterium]